MPRKLRFFVAGGFKHVLLRGNNRGDIFIEEGDRDSWQPLLHKRPDQLQSRSRRRLYSAIRVEVAIAAVDDGVATSSEVASRFGRAHSGLSRTINRLRDHRQ